MNWSVAGLFYGLYISFSLERFQELLIFCQSRHVDGTYGNAFYQKQRVKN